MPWGNSWSGGGQVVASSVQVVDSNNKVVASINGQGVITGSGFVDNGSFTYDGIELTNIFNEYPRGTIASGSGSGSLTLGTQERLFAVGSFVAQPGRSYWIHASPVELDPQTTGRTAYGRWRYRTDGVTPTPSDPLVFGAYSPASYGKTAWGQSIVVDGYIINSGTTPVTYTLGLFYGIGEGDTTTSLNVYFGQGSFCCVMDMGPAAGPTVNNNAFTIMSQANTPPTPGPVQHSFSDIDIATASYMGNHQQSAGSGADLGSYMYFGQDPGYSPNGIWRSYFWTDPSHLSAMAGYASLTQLDIYVYADWWYSTGGGTLCIGYTTYNPGGPAAPTTEPAGAVYNLVQAQYTGRGQGQWISLLGNSTITNAIHAGTFGGIVLGPDQAGYGYYGYAEAHDSTFARPTLRATYTK